MASLWLISWASISSHPTLQALRPSQRLRSPAVIHPKTQQAPPHTSTSHTVRPIHFSKPSLPHTTILVFVSSTKQSSPSLSRRFRQRPQGAYPRPSACPLLARCRQGTRLSTRSPGARRGGHGQEPVGGFVCNLFAHGAQETVALECIHA